MKFSSSLSFFISFCCCCWCAFGNGSMRRTSRLELSSNSNSSFAQWNLRFCASAHIVQIVEPHTKNTIDLRPHTAPHRTVAKNPIRLNLIFKQKKKCILKIRRLLVASSRRSEWNTLLSRRLFCCHCCVHTHIHYSLLFPVFYAF